jgi:hypothetical protein
MEVTQAMQRHWPKLLAVLLALVFTAILAREIPPMIRYIKMERM